MKRGKINKLAAIDALVLLVTTNSKYVRNKSCNNATVSNTHTVFYFNFWENQFQFDNPMFSGPKIPRSPLSAMLPALVSIESPI